MSLPSTSEIPNYPLFLNARQYDAEWLRMYTWLLQNGQNISEGVFTYGNYFGATSGGSGLQINVGAGQAAIQGDDRSSQGIYIAYNDTTRMVTATAANATNPRIDRLVLQMYDSDVTGAQNKWAIELVPGTPTVGATLTNLSGAAVVPNSALLLYNVLVPATFTGPFVPATHFQDRRHGVFQPNTFLRTTAPGAAQAANGANFVGPGDVMSLTVIGNGVNAVQLRVTTPLLYNTTALNTALVEVWDGAGGTGTRYSRATTYAPAVNTGAAVNSFGTCNAFSGQKTFYAYVNTSPGGTPTMQGAASYPAFFNVRWL
jgi:hypothetical protein